MNEKLGEMDFESRENRKQATPVETHVILSSGNHSARAFLISQYTLASQRDKIMCEMRRAVSSKIVSNTGSCTS